MKEYTAQELKGLIKTHGRTFFDNGKKALFFNWTCSGFSVTFTGTVLRAKILAYSDQLLSPPHMPENPVDYPCIGTVGEDDTLIYRVKCSEGEAWYDVFEAADDGEHTIRIVKLSENMRGKTALLALETDGEIIKCIVPEKGLKIEFVGDSITCGFGNEAPNRDCLFETSEENGWMTYGAICGRELDAEFNMISVSGISANASKYPMIPGKSMNDVYKYTDIYGDERLEKEPCLWEFAANRKDIVVVNLGTNDSGRMWSYKELSKADEEESWFCERYREFIEKLRRLNGPEAKIVCTLGPMDFYLYDKIEKAVNKYKEDTGDENIYSFKIIGVNLISEGFGAVSHPSLKTHARMGKELASRLKNLL